MDDGDNAAMRIGEFDSEELEPSIAELTLLH